VRITGFVWLEEIVEKLWQKHRVEQYEAEEVVGSRSHFRFVEKGYRAGEDVYAALGQTNGGRYLIVFLVYKNDGRALIVSARDMTPAERRQYEKR
jgi:uncharacterized protein